MKNILANIKDIGKFKKDIGKYKKNDGQGGEARSQLHDGHPADQEGEDKSCCCWSQR